MYLPSCSIHGLGYICVVPSPYHTFMRICMFSHTFISMHTYICKPPNTITQQSYMHIALGPRYVVELGEKILDYNENFHLFLATRSPESQLPPNVSSVLAIINFTTTRAGLQGQVGWTITITAKSNCLPIRSANFRLQKISEMCISMLALSLIQCSIPSSYEFSYFPVINYGRY